MGQVGHYQSRNSYLSQIASRIGLEKLEPDLNFFFFINMRGHIEEIVRIFVLTNLFF